MKWSPLPLSSFVGDENIPDLLTDLRFGNLLCAPFLDQARLEPDLNEEKQWIIRLAPSKECLQKDKTDYQGGSKNFNIATKIKFWLSRSHSPLFTSSCRLKKVRSLSIQGTATTESTSSSSAQQQIAWWTQAVGDMSENFFILLADCDGNFPTWAPHLFFRVCKITLFRALHVQLFSFNMSPTTSGRVDKKRTSGRKDENNIGAGFLFWAGELMCCDHLSAGMIGLSCSVLIFQKFLIWWHSWSVLIFQKILICCVVIVVSLGSKCDCWHVGKCCCWHVSS